jgi:transcriptional regulator with PAS, ATPase and Fis domain
MTNQNWAKELPVAITVCDGDGIVLEMNEKAIKTFESDGGEKLIGTNLLDCHPEPSRTKVKEMLSSQSQNVYTIEKNGVKKLIYQVPWHEDGKYAGLVEFSMEIPFDMPHFVRKNT